MRLKPKPALLIGWALFALACGASVQVGKYNLLQSDWEQDRGQISERAAFELKCPSEQLELTVLSTINNTNSRDWAKQVGVAGCGHRLVYVRMGYPNSGWVLNSSDSQPR